MNQIIHQPEDKFFKQSLSDIRVAKDFFEEHLPPAILNQLDLNSLKLQNQTFIDEAYKNTEADIVYKANFNQQSGFIYTLLEHQSKTDHYMALRLLSYCLRIIEQHRKQNPKKPLPIVYSMIVYTGKPIWKAPLDIFELFSEPTLARETLLNPQLIDVQRLEDERLKQHPWSGLLEFALKYRKSRDLEQYLKELFPWLKKIEVYSGLEYAKITLDLGLNIFNKEEIEILEKMADEHLSDTLRGEAMTLAQAYEQRGLEKGLSQGLSQGRQEGRLEVLQLLKEKLLQRGEKPEVVAELTGLSLDEIY